MRIFVYGLLNNIQKYSKIQNMQEKRIRSFDGLTLCGTRKLQFFYVEILPEFKNRPMPKTVNATLKLETNVIKSTVTQMS